MSQQVTENLIKVTRLHFVNAYLVREDDGFTLIDTGLPRGAGALLQAAQEAGAPIRRIALTHGHLDHAGSVDELRQRLGEAVEVLVGEADAGIWEGRYPGAKKPPGSWPGKVSSRIDVLLRGGERVGSLEVVATPGHTPGHVSFLDTRDRSLIAGDVFVSIGGLAVTDHFHLPFPLARMGTWDTEKDRESARALRDLKPSLIVVGHGGPVRDPGAKLDAAVG